MDIFRFLNPTDATRFNQGRIVNGLKTKMWAERYREAGEFEFTADVSQNVQTQLPVGSFVSHIDSDEVMMVENHEIRDDLGSNAVVKITGRSFEAFLENRAVGANKAWPTAASATTEYLLPADYSWNQAVLMIKDHIYLSNVYDPDDAIPYVEVLSTVSGVSVAEERSIARGDLYSRVMELLVVDDLGIKTMRPGPRSPLGLGDINLALVIHKGDDLRTDVIFSHLTGEIESADYLWTNKKIKNAALITGRWVETMVKMDAAGIDRRVMLIDGSDIDRSFSDPPTGEDLIIVRELMESRGRAILLSQRDLSLIKTEATKNSTMYKYREHYDLGDIVTVEGEYRETAPMQVAEYVEIEDENGSNGYPTLSAI